MDIKTFFESQESFGGRREADVRAIGEAWALEALATEADDERPLHLMNPEELLLLLEEDDD